jgi:hypothetical protein
MERDEAGTLARLRTLRRDLIDPKIAEHKGRIVKTTGDGLLVEFPSLVEAVACAVAVQREMAARNDATAEDERIQFRVGINSGDVIVEDDDIHGDGVNIAARLEGIAEPGGICVSGIVHDQVQGRLDCAFADIGERSLKNITRPVRVYPARAPEDRRGRTGRLLRSSQPVAARHQREHQRAAAPVLPKEHRSQRAQCRGHWSRGGCPQRTAAKDACLENTGRGAQPVASSCQQRLCCDDHLNPPSIARSTIRPSSASTAS